MSRYGSTISSRDVLVALIAVRASLTARGTWTQGAEARDVEGRPVDPLCEGAVAFCIQGCVYRQTRCAPPLVHRCREALRRAAESRFGLSNLVEFNDEGERTLDHILEVLDLAITMELERLGKERSKSGVINLATGEPDLCPGGRS